MSDNETISVSADPYNYTGMPQYATTFIIASAASAYVIVAHFADKSTPFFAAVGTGVIAALACLMWQLRRRKLLWLMLGIAAILHIFVISLIPWPDNISYGFAFTPVAVVDALACYKIIIAILKWFDKPKAYD